MRSFADFHCGGDIKARFTDVNIPPRVFKVIITRDPPQVAFPADPYGQVWNTDAVYNADAKLVSVHVAAPLFRSTPLHHSVDP